MTKVTCTHRRKIFFACGSSAQVKVEREGGAAAWLTPSGAKYAETWTASTPGVMALSESVFEPLVAGGQKVSLASLSP